MTVVARALHFERDGATAQEVRRMLFHMFGQVEGPWFPTDLDPSVGTGLTVDIADGAAIVLGTEQTYQGAYFCENRGVETVSLAAADSTHERWDLIVLKVEDAEISGTVNVASIVPVTGTPAATPVDPTPPPSSIVLARARVPANATTPSQVDDRRHGYSQQVVSGVASRSAIVAEETFNTATTTSSAGTSTVLTVDVPVIEGLTYEINLNTGVWTGTASTERTEWKTNLTGTMIFDFIEDTERRSRFAKALYTATATTTISVTVQVEVNGVGITKDTGEAALQFWVREAVA